MCVFIGQNLVMCVFTWFGETEGRGRGSEARFGFEESCVVNKAIYGP